MKRNVAVSVEVAINKRITVEENPATGGVGIVVGVGVGDYVSVDLRGLGLVLVQLLGLRGLTGGCLKGYVVGWLRCFCRSCDRCCLVKEI